MTRITLFLLAVLYAMAAQAQNIGTTFKTKSDDVKMRFTITSLSPKEVRLSFVDPDAKVINIPEHVGYKKNIYTVTSIGNNGNSIFASESNSSLPLGIVVNTIVALCKSTSAILPHNNLHTVIVPATVKTIENYAFDNCPNLYNLTLPDTNISIGELAFRNCSKLKTNPLVAHRIPANTPMKQDDKPVLAQKEADKPSATAPKAKKSDVDINIPRSKKSSENTFAVIICNEIYQDVAEVPGAINDGEVFTNYCKNTLGLPQTNIHTVKNATLNNMKREINWLKQVTEAYQGEAKVIFYYAGHGVPDESTQASYLLPVDGFGTDLTTAYSLNSLYSTLSAMPTKQITVFMDACFSGAQRGDGMLVAARGVAIKAKAEVPKSNMVVFSAAQGDETAYPYEEKGHGLFTYYLLKKLQETKGNVSLGELGDYIKTEVSKRSIVVNGKPQTPSTAASSTLGEEWKKWKLQ